jgi:hypothetical protein
MVMDPRTLPQKWQGGLVEQHKLAGAIEWRALSTFSINLRRTI